ncbi:hypothetical protein SCLCIDRAFT_1119387 [Scleroderma citrinum Foug A]|uniref:Uncharacterized protein n=1 Tax=Scleroderma citrinum Foug A TaxID=1036808 RepID=A0A0C3DAK1_9AGAM|nr:hypothetical protein SCLCIDRAFT_1119387 [Scleroderma citrinum Foug A]
MTKETHKTANSPSSQRRQSPYPTPTASGGHSGRQKEAEGPPHLYEPLVVNLTTSAENEWSSAVLEEFMAIDLENVRAVVLKPSTSTGPGETTERGRVGATHKVPDDIQPVPTVLGNTQDAEAAITQLDSINTGYRQTLSTFSTVVNGITRVCHPNRRQPCLTNDHA